MSDQPSRATRLTRAGMAGRALLAGAAFLAVTFAGFALASSVGDESATSTAIDETGEGSEAEAVTDDVASSLVVAVPDGADTGASAQAEPEAEAAPAVVVDPTVAPTIVGVVTVVDGTPVSGAEVHLYAAVENDEPGDLVHTALTSTNGAYEIPAPVGCYVVRLVAPPGRSFLNAGASRDVPTCVNATIVRIAIDAQLEVG